MPVILATQEAEIRRIAVQSQPRQIGHETLSQKFGLVEWFKVSAQVQAGFKLQYYKKKK
jgi:hypothetical protein